MKPYEVYAKRVRDELNAKDNLMHVQSYVSN